MKFKTIIGIVWAALLITATNAFAQNRPNRGNSGDRVLIEVNGLTVTQQKFREEFEREWADLKRNQNISEDDNSSEDMKNRLAMQILDNMIERNLFLSFSKKEKVKVPSDSVQTELQRIIETYPDEATFDSALVASGRTRAELKKRIGEELMIREYVKRRIDMSEPSETEAKIFYATNRSKFSQTAMVHAKHILVADDTNAQKTLRDIRRRFEKGDSFASLAQEYSIDYGSASQGGDLGYFGKGRMVQPFEDAAFSLPIGKISDPVKTQFGWHLILVEDKQPERILGFDEVKDKIISLLSDRKSNLEVQKLSLKLRLKSVIKVNGPVL